MRVLYKQLHQSKHSIFSALLELCHHHSSQNTSAHNIKFQYIKSSKFLVSSVLSCNIFKDISSVKYKGTCILGHWFWPHIVLISSYSLTCSGLSMPVNTLYIFLCSSTHFFTLSALFLVIFFFFTLKIFGTFLALFRTYLCCTKFRTIYFYMGKDIINLSLCKNCKFKKHLPRKKQKPILTRSTCCIALFLISGM